MELGVEMGTALDGTDHAAIARGFGGHGETVDDAGQLPAGRAFGSMNRDGWDALTRRRPAQARPRAP